MTQKELDQKLVKDIVWIYNEAGLWNPELENTGLFTREAKLMAIMAALNAQEEDSIITKITRLLEEDPSKQSYGFLTRDFLNATTSLLRFRTKERKKVKPITDIDDENFFTQENIDLLNATLTHDGDSTVIPYRLIDEAGTKRKLLLRLQNELRRSDIQLDVIQTEPWALREKNVFLGHRIWAMTPGFPVLKLYVEKEE